MRGGGLGGVDRTGVVAGKSEQVSGAAEIKGVCSASQGRFAVCLVAGDGASFKYQIRLPNKP